MLNRGKVLNALETKLTDFESFLTAQKEQGALLTELVDQLKALDYETIQKKLEFGGVVWPGANPTPELDRAEEWCMPFDQRWLSHREAREWALSILHDRPVLAVDGSQIAPTKDFSLPIGAVQIGWFVNPHQADMRHEKDVAFEILTPQELVGGAEKDGTDPEIDHAGRRINEVRFVRECEMLRELMARHRNEPDHAKPLCFFDGSFVISFAGQLAQDVAQPYLSAIRSLLEDSERYHVPLVGFVDNPYSRDVVNMIDTYFGRSDEEREQNRVTDAQLFAQLLPSTAWAMRSPLFSCARRDALTRVDEQKGSSRASFYRDVAFTYVRFSQNRPPARIELPKWIVKEGRVEEMVNLVRAECVFGAGYPYAIETADALAVISQQDRQRFYRLFQQFGDDNALDVIMARKAASKLQRR